MRCEVFVVLKVCLLRSVQSAWVPFASSEMKNAPGKEHIHLVPRAGIELRGKITIMRDLCEHFQIFHAKMHAL